MVLLFYTTYISRDLAYHEIFRSKVGTGGINFDIKFTRQSFDNAFLNRDACLVI